MPNKRAQRNSVTRLLYAKATTIGNASILRTQYFLSEICRSFAAMENSKNCTHNVSSHPSNKLQGVIIIIDVY
jgi:hypothetical protein